MARLNAALPGAGIWGIAAGGHARAPHPDRLPGVDTLPRPGHRRAVPPGPRRGLRLPGGVPTLGNQLSAAGRSWAAYLQDMGKTTRGRDHTVATARGPSCGHPGMHRLARVSSSASGWPGGPTSSMSATMPARSAWPGRIGCSPTRMTHQSPLLRCPGKPGFPPALLRRAASRWIVSIRRPAPAATPPGPGDPGQDSPLPPTRLDALGDRHLPIVPARSGTGRRSGADGSIVTDTPR